MHFAIINTLTDLHHILHYIQTCTLPHDATCTCFSHRSVPENFNHDMRVLYLPVPVSRSRPSSIAGFTRFHTCWAVAQKAVFVASKHSICTVFAFNFVQSTSNSHKHHSKPSQWIYNRKSSGRSLWHHPVCGIRAHLFCVVHSFDMLWSILILPVSHCLTGIPYHPGVAWCRNLLYVQSTVYKPSRLSSGAIQTGAAASPGVGQCSQCIVHPLWKAPLCSHTPHLRNWFANRQSKFQVISYTKYTDIDLDSEVSDFRRRHLRRWWQGNYPARHWPHFFQSRLHTSMIKHVLQISKVWPWLSSQLRQQAFFNVNTSDNSQCLFVAIPSLLALHGKSGMIGETEHDFCLRLGSPWVSLRALSSLTSAIFEPDPVSESRLLDWYEGASESPFWLTGVFETKQLCNNRSKSSRASLGIAAVEWSGTSATHLMMFLSIQKSKPICWG